MSLENIPEQPHASSKPPSDFNDLHVIAGLDEVGRQIQEAVSTIHLTVVDSPDPFDYADQYLGQVVENGAENWTSSPQEMMQGNDFELDYATPMNEKPSSGKQKQGEIKTTDEKLREALERYALINCTTNVFDYKTNHKFKITALKHSLGNANFNNWTNHHLRKTIEIDEVEKILIDQAGSSTPNMMKNCILLKGESFVYDKSLNRVVTWSAVQLLYPLEYKKWIESPTRSEIDYENLIFDPTRKIDADPNYINTFEGYGVEPLRDQDFKIINKIEASIHCTAILEMINSLCNDDPEIVDWLLKWLAFPLQNEGRKAHSAVLMASHIQGSGKTTLFEKIMGGIYGKYHRMITSQELESPQYNGWLNNTAFIFGEEIATNATKYNVTPYLNALITAKSVTINEKHRPQKQVPAYFNMAFASNENIPFPLTGEARRWFVIAPQQKLEESIANRVHEEMREDGIAAFYSYLLNLDLTEFKHDKPPLTDAKKSLMNASKRSIEVFIDEWFAGETKYPCVSCQAKQLYEAYKEWASSTLEHKYSYRRFTDDIKKIEGIRLLEKQHWRYQRKQGQSLIVAVGASPQDKNAIDWYGECVDRFDEAQNGGFPNVLDK